VGKRLPFLVNYNPETLCTNRGHRNVRVFEDYDEPRIWALEGS